MKLTLAPVFATLAILPAFARAESVVQSAPFSATHSYTGSNTVQVVDQTFFTAAMHPFNPALGKLDSFTIEWEVSGALKGTVAAGNEGGTAEGTTGGTYLLDTVSFNGNGGGNGTGAGPGGTIDATFAPAPFSQSFQAADAGMSYNPALLSIVTGATDFPVSWNSPVNATFTNMAILDVTVTGKVTVTYSYTPVVPLEFTGITRDPVSKAVTLTWKSEAGKIYTVDASADLSGWGTIAPSVEAGAGETSSYTDAEIPADSPSRFYRIREAAPAGALK